MWSLYSFNFLINCNLKNRPKYPSTFLYFIERATNFDKMDINSWKLLYNHYWGWWFKKKHSERFFFKYSLQHWQIKKNTWWAFRQISKCALIILKQMFENILFAYIELIFWKFSFWYLSREKILTIEFMGSQFVKWNDFFSQNLLLTAEWNYNMMVRQIKAAWI